MKSLSVSLAFAFVSIALPAVAFAQAAPPASNNGPVIVYTQPSAAPAPAPAPAAAPPRSAAPAPPLPPPPPPEAEEKGDDDAPRRKGRPEFVIAALGSRRQLFEIPSWNFGGEVGLLMRSKGRFAIGIFGEHQRGSTDLGVREYLTRFRAAPQLAVTSWLELGGSIGFAYLAIERATTHTLLRRMGLHLGLEANFNVLSTDDLTIFIAPRAETDLLWGNAALWGGTAAVGARF